MYHNIVVKGEETRPTEIVPAAMQREVLGLLLSAVEPASLALSEPLLVQLTPTPGNNLEDLSSDAAFDHLKAARILSALVLEPLARGRPRGAAGDVCRSAERRAHAARAGAGDVDGHVEGAARCATRAIVRCAASRSAWRSTR